MQEACAKWVGLDAELVPAFKSARGEEAIAHSLPWLICLDAAAHGPVIDLRPDLQWPVELLRWPVFVWPQMILARPE